MNQVYFKNHFLQEVPRGLMARIAGFHPAGPGSIPGVGEFVFLVLFSRAIYKKNSKEKSIWFNQIDNFHTLF